MSKLKRWSVLAAGMSFLFAGCASMTTFQTAETLDPGQGTYYAAYVPTKAPNFLVVDSTLDYKTGEVGGRLGIFPNFDLGAKVYPVGALFDGKYQFLDAGMYKAAGDLGFGYMTITYSSDSDTSKTSILDITPMMLFTVRPVDWVSFTIAPKGLMRVSMPEGGETGYTFLGGGTGTLKFHVGNLGAFVGEYGYVTGDYSMSHVALGVEWPFSLFGQN
ncbi:MAG: hypothetical protein ACLFVQ_11425 [Chitinispirillaceae bacterium]